PPTEPSKLREEFISATKEYKASLGKLLPFYENDVKKAEEKLEQSKKLLAEGLIPKTQLEEYERALAVAKQKVAETNRSLTSADEPVAGTSATPGKFSASFTTPSTSSFRSQCSDREQFTIAGDWTITTPWISS